MATQTRIKHGLVGMEGIVSIGYYFRVLQNCACANKESDIINEQDKCISMRMYLQTILLINWHFYKREGHLKSECQKQRNKEKNLLLFI